MAALRLITGFLIFVALTSSALANMPPKRFDHPYSGKIAMTRKAVPFGQAYAACDKLHMRYYGTHYPKSGGLAGIGPTYGCALYDEAKGIAIAVFSFDTPELAAKRLAKGSKQPYDQCMAYNSFIHERGHLIAYALGIDTSDHAGWNGVSKCTYDKPALDLPSS